MKTGGPRGAVLALVGLVGCLSDPQPPVPAAANPPVTQSARLERFETCEALEAYIEDTAVLDMRSSLERFRPSHRGGTDLAQRFTATPSDSTAASSGDTGPHPREADVEEADFVKSDGARFFTLSGSSLVVYGSWPAESLRYLSAVRFEGWPRQMLLRGDRVLVFSSAFDDPSKDFPRRESTRVSLVDVSRPAEPWVVGEMVLPGEYQNAWREGSAVRLVLRDPFAFPNDVRLSLDPDEAREQDGERLERDIDRLMDANEKLIRARTLKDWWREGGFQRRFARWWEWGTLGQSCQDFYKTNAPTPLGFVTVASIDLDTAFDQEPGLTTLVAWPDVLYATADALYVATPHRWWRGEPGQSDSTYVHKFDRESPRGARYVASGTLEGHLTGRSSLDEREGVLRAAVTLSRRVEDPGSPWGRSETAQRVTTLRQDGDRLRTLGQSEEWAPGERISRARFLGDKGYVAILDPKAPLFTVDLSDPAHPRQVGELEVPGSSTYIHPLDDTHLLTLRWEAREDAEGHDTSPGSSTLSLFDVSDPAHPREAFTQKLDTGFVNGQALYKHQAFNLFPARGLLAIPFTDRKLSALRTDSFWSSVVSELRVFHVGVETGFSLVGVLSLSDMYHDLSPAPSGDGLLPGVRRSVMADDDVYAITDVGVRVSQVDQLASPLATVRSY